MREQHTEAVIVVGEAWGDEKYAERGEVTAVFAATDMVAAGVAPPKRPAA